VDLRVPSRIRMDGLASLPRLILGQFFHQIFRQARGRLHAAFDGPEFLDHKIPVTIAGLCFFRHAGNLQA